MARKRCWRAGGLGSRKLLRVAVPDHRRGGLHRFPSRGRAARPGRPGPRARRPLDRARSRTSATSRTGPGFGYTIESAVNAPLVAELVDEADVVYHLAAAVGVELIVESPVRTIETNVHCTEVVLTQANKKKKPVFIASTSEVYGKSEQLPFREDGDLLLGPTNTGRWAYACSKAIDEYLGLAYCKEKRPAGGRRAPVQHGRAAADRPLRDGRAELRAPGAGRQADHGLRRRHAAALLLPRQGRRAGALAT